MENFEATNGEASQAETSGVANESPLDRLAARFGAIDSKEVVAQPEAETAVEHEDASQAEPEAEVDDEPEFELVVDGKAEKIKQKKLLAEAQKYLAADKRFNEAANLRKTADEELNAYKSERATLQQVLQRYEQQMTASLTANQPDWNKLLADDPIEFVRQKELWNAHLAQIEEARKGQEYLKAQAAKENEINLSKYKQQETEKLMTMYPEWKTNPDAAKKAATQIDSFLKGVGFSAEDIGTIHDARFVVVAHKAALYDELVKSTPELAAKQKGGKSVNLEPGVQKPLSNAAVKRNVAKQQHAKNPTVDSLTKLFMK